MGSYNKDLFSSPLQKVERSEYNETARAKIRSLKFARWSNNRIIKESGFPRILVRRILKAESSHRDRKSKEYKPRLLLDRQIRLLVTQGLGFDCNQM
jgi:hypothetical protein